MQDARETPSIWAFIQFKSHVYLKHFIGNLVIECGEVDGLNDTTKFQQLLLFNIFSNAMEKRSIKIWNELTAHVFRMRTQRQFSQNVWIIYCERIFDKNSFK